MSKILGETTLLVCIEPKLRGLAASKKVESLTFHSEIVKMSNLDSTVIFQTERIFCHFSQSNGKDRISVFYLQTLITALL